MKAFLLSADGGSLCCLLFARLGRLILPGTPVQLRPSLAQHFITHNNSDQLLSLLYELLMHCKVLYSSKHPEIHPSIDPILIHTCLDVLDRLRWTIKDHPRPSKTNPEQSDKFWLKTTKLTIKHPPSVRRCRGAGAKRGYGKCP